MEDHVWIPLPEGWRDGPAPNPQQHGMVPDPYWIIQWRVADAYWQVLAWRHDGQEEKAIAAERQCAACAAELRRSFDPDPLLGPQAADAAIAWAVVQAKRRFAEDLRCERRRWRLERGRERHYF